jgi:sugar/nucleoside kinase (ribokinase family)
LCLYFALLRLCIENLRVHRRSSANRSKRLSPFLPKKREQHRMPHVSIPDICCIGHLTLDRVITPGTTVEMPGGTSFYFSCALSQMDLSYLLVTTPGDLAGGAVDLIRAKGIRVHTLPAAHTVVFENKYGHNRDHRTQRVLQEATPLSLHHLQGVDARIFHLGPLLAGDIPEAAIPMLAARGKVSLDVQGYLRKVTEGKVAPIDWESKRDWLPHIHYLKVSEEEMVVLTGCTDAEKGARLLCAWGVQEAIVTLGSRGSVICSEDQLHHIPAYAPDTTTDVTGCGDTYMAGYLYQRSKGLPVPEAGRFAAAMATLKIGVSGPFSGDEAAVKAVLQKEVLVA